MSQHEITSMHDLLDENGHLAEAGYARKLLLKYDRSMVKTPKWRIKEWDYYFIGNSKYGIALTLADNSYMGLAGVTFFDFEKKDKTNYAKFLLFPMGKLNLPTKSSKGVSEYQSKKISLCFKVSDNIHHLTCDVPNFKDGKALHVDVKLTNVPEETIVMATPFKENKKAFYYNQKINNLVAHGQFTIGDEVYDLTDNLGVFDWGRGVWIYDSTWYWSSLSTRLPDGSMFGFNLGYGFGDTSAATENILFYNGKGHKLEHVDFGIPEKDGKDDFMSPWHFTSSDNRLELTFTPVFDNVQKTNLLILGQDGHQVFGYFNGKAVLDDGTVIELKDAFGFAEKIRNRW